MKHLQSIGYNNLEYDERRNMPAGKGGDLYRGTRTGNAYLVRGNRAFSLSTLLGGWQDLEDIKENKPQQQKVMAVLILVLLFM